MRSPEYAPFFRSTVGFDRLFNTLDTRVKSEWPPYNIEKKSENAYRIVMAVAGFSPDEVELTQHGPELTVIGHKTADENDRLVLHRGLAIGNFKQVFELADYVKVASASLENGLLSIELAREIPEELKPRRIAIVSAPDATASVEATGGEIRQDIRPRHRAA